MDRHNLQPQDRPVPVIDPARCTGCGLCVKVCPTGALAMNGARAVVAHPEACEYHGLCETICPTQAIQRAFEIVLCEHETVEGAEMAAVLAGATSENAQKTGLLEQVGAYKPRTIGL